MTTAHIDPVFETWTTEQVRAELDTTQRILQNRSRDRLTQTAVASLIGRRARLEQVLYQRAGQSETPTPLPFLVPAANLVAGDVVADSADGAVRGGTVAAINIHPGGGLIEVTWTDHSRGAFTADRLVEVTNRRPAALAAVVAELTALADTWERVSSGRDRSVMTCVDQLRALLGRLA